MMRLRLQSLTCSLADLDLTPKAQYGDLNADDGPVFRSIPYNLAITLRYSLL